MTNNLKKYVVSLHQKKYRQKYEKFIVQGPKIVEEVLKSNLLTLDTLFCLQSWYDDNQTLIQNVNIPVDIISRKELQTISTLKTPNQVLLVAHQSKAKSSWNMGEDWAIYLDNIQDAGNLGTIIRLADWFGVPQIILNHQCVEWHSPKVIQSTMGSFLRINYCKGDLEDYVGKVPIYVTGMHGDNISQSTLKPGIIVIGNESKGVSKNTFEHASKIISIPKIGQAESLNAAMATGIILYQMKIIQAL